MLESESGVGFSKLMESESGVGVSFSKLLESESGVRILKNLLTPQPWLLAHATAKEMWQLPISY